MLVTCLIRLNWISQQRANSMKEIVIQRERYSDMADSFKWPQPATLPNVIWWLLVCPCVSFADSHDTHFDVCVCVCLVVWCAILAWFSFGSHRLTFAQPISIRLTLIGQFVWGLVFVLGIGTVRGTILINTWVLSCVDYTWNKFKVLTIRFSFSPTVSSNSPFPKLIITRDTHGLQYFQQCFDQFFVREELTPRELAIFHVRDSGFWPNQLIFFSMTPFSPLQIRILICTRCAPRTDRRERYNVAPVGNVLHNYNC